MSQFLDLATEHLSTLTAADWRIGGTLKETPADFLVEEIPIYLPVGEGEHLFLWIEKRDISAEFLLQHLAKNLKIQRDDIGQAGLKDRRAITRQWVSVPADCESRIESLSTEHIQVLQAKRHLNKLKTGHLRGNRFCIVVRNVSADALEIALKIRDEIQSRGIPHYFGSQRFGIDGETLRIGQTLLDGSLNPEQIPRQKRKFLVRLALSSVQSMLFNAILNDRLQSGTSHTVLPGDVLQVVASGGPFVSTDPAFDQTRFDTKEVVTTGPLFGPKMKLPEAEQLAYEMGFLKRFDLKMDDFSKFKKLTSGTRRPLLLWLDHLNVFPVNESPVDISPADSVSLTGQHVGSIVPVDHLACAANGPSISQTAIRFEFDLPTGAYATMVLREFMKNDALEEFRPPQS